MCVKKPAKKPGGHLTPNWVNMCRPQINDWILISAKSVGKFGKIDPIISSNLSPIRGVYWKLSPN